MLLPLVGPRLQLRPFDLADVPAAHRIYSDERVMRWVGDGPVGRVQETKAMLSEYIEHQQARGFSFWAVIQRQSGELIGDAGLYPRAGDVELGYTLGYEHWGKGYGTEAARLCVEAAFVELGFSQLIALIRPENTSSAAVASKLGFEPGERISAYGSDHVLYRLRRQARGADCAQSISPGVGDGGGAVDRG